MSRPVSPWQYCSLCLNRRGPMCPSHRCNDAVRGLDPHERLGKAVVEFHDELPKVFAQKALHIVNDFSDKTLGRHGARPVGIGTSGGF